MQNIARLVRSGASAAAVGLLVFLVPVVRAGEVVAVRGGLPNLGPILAETKKPGNMPARIMYLGGAVTKGRGASQERFCYRSLLTQEIRRRFPKSPLVEYDHSIACGGSWLAAFRTPTDAVQHYLPLALVVLEFAVDDAGEPQPRVVAAMEGIVRQVRTAHPQAEILLLYAFSKDQLDVLRQGRVPDAIAWHEQVAAHYNLPSVNAARFLADRIASGKSKLDELTADGTHPTDKGHALCLEAVQRLFDECKLSETAPGDAGAARPVKHSLPPPLSRRPMDKARFVAYEDAAMEPGWRVGQENPLEAAQYSSAVGQFRHVLVCDRPGPVLTLKFRGDTIGWFGAAGPDRGDLECRIDGGPWRLKPAPSPAPPSKEEAPAPRAAGTPLRPAACLLAEDLDPAAVHELQLRVPAAPADGRPRAARIGYFLVNGTSAAESYKGMTPLERIDAIYKGMAPLQYEPPDGRWKHLTQTMKRLREGPSLRIVMLGDSIVNDTASSNYELLLERRYPKCKVAKVRSVRGSTGCWWYKEENRVKEWVLDHNPDLLMIGGISQRDDVESIRAVIRQVRQARPAVEVLLMSPAFGTQDPRTDPQWTLAVDLQGTGYRSRLARLATEEQVEFIDMNGPWGRYLRESDKARGWFMRDPVHANDRGFQILGRILDRYFAP